MRAYTDKKLTVKQHPREIPWVVAIGLHPGMAQDRQCPIEAPPFGALPCCATDLRKRPAGGTPIAPAMLHLDCEGPRIDAGLIIGDVLDRRRAVRPGHDVIGHQLVDLAGLRDVARAGDLAAGRRAQPGKAIEAVAVRGRVGIVDEDIAIALPRAAAVLRVGRMIDDRQGRGLEVEHAFAFRSADRLSTIILHDMSSPRNATAAYRVT